MKPEICREKKCESLEELQTSPFCMLAEEWIGKIPSCPKQKKCERCHKCFGEGYLLIVRGPREVRIVCNRCGGDGLENTAICHGSGKEVIKSE
jgi:hypothetical protein